MAELPGKSNLPNAAMLANVHHVLKLGLNLQQRDDHLPGFGVVYGPSGYGKSVAAAVLSTATGAGYVECRSTWTKRDLIEAIAIELGVKPKSTVSKTVDAVGYQLIEANKLLIIDEADILVDRNMIELIRDLEKQAKAPIVLVGEETLPEKLKRYERVHNRVLDWHPMAPATLADARELSKMFVKGVKVADDLLSLLIDRSHGRVRRIVVNLDKIRKEATVLGVDVADAKWWGDRPLYTGDAPTRKARVQ